MKFANAWRAVLGAIVAMVFGQHVGAQEMTKLKLAYISLNSSVSIFIAKDKGMFEKRGLDVELVLMRSAVDVVPGLVSGSVQIGMIPETSLVQAADSGIDLVALNGNSMFRKGARDGAFIARIGSDIKEAKDIKGKKIVAISIGSVQQVLFEKWLSLQGVDKATIASIQYSEASLPQMVDIIKTGTVDGALVAEPFSTAILKQGSGNVVSYFTGEMPEDTQGMINAVTGDWAAKNTKAIQAFRDAIKELTAYANANQDEARATIVKWLNLRPEVVAATRFPDLTDEVTVHYIQWWINTMTEQDRLRTKLDPTKLIAK